ncbi:Vitamin B12 ABC transporter, B12-binding component BtuF [Rhodovulum sp. P5]|uniref:ABC transporter substrate-binding protein n=1 Tax=Rhodovulum sp. P5 TaxID=1564506 RepID=UPI0009C3ACB3|nr:ABC transporter substrate-binding protein [Rhodovulum sp. P5]ARE39825.1 Vitamin B12 ABC transporter, B12-binding component BtuF [Rhodovulum sp. P5]
MRGWLPLAAAFGLALSGAGHAAPSRVVSMNLCTDQLALMLAAPGQLVSVSVFAKQPQTSVMAEAAQAYPNNHGLAEEIYLLNPDLVVTGQFTGQDTVSMLRRLGVPVVTMAPAYSLNDIRDRITEMGQHLGREETAAEIVAQFDADLTALTADSPDERPRAAVYTAQGYTPGPNSLSGAMLEAAGFDNLATELGLSVGGRIPLEQLVMLDPDLVVLPTPWPGASRAEDILTHPVLKKLQARAGTAPLADRDWVCGTPHVLRAIAGLVAARKTLEDAQ